ncbi:MAG: FAD-dependent oxidoreductase [Lachnospiraceae bacterium]|nr:FAD-dependent oxidoreductase [Lachnospiraceae bacterium]
MNYPNLFKPIQIGDTLFRNRIFAAPMGHPDNVMGKFSDDCIAFFERKAMGGAAAVTLGEACVDSVYGKGYAAEISLDSRQPLRGLTKMADAIRRHGAIPSIELQHPGMKAVPKVYTPGVGTTSDIVYGPSDDEFAGYPVKEMPEEIIYEIIEKFANAAKFCKDAGFGMVMVHAGHGWLLNQFMCSRINHRTDKWGGSMENRARFTVEVVDAIHKKCGKGFPVEVRISADECSPYGYTVEEGAAFAQMLVGHADLINCSVGCGVGLPDKARTTVITFPSMYGQDGQNVKYAAAVKEKVSGVYISTVGALTDPAMMEDIIASGKADIVEIGRGLTCDPDIPYKARDGREDEIVRCMRCNACFSSGMQKGHFWCALNPAANREREFARITKPAEKKKVLVVGGGIAGMQVALTAAENGHEVVLCEKDGALGGHIRCEEQVPFKKHLKEYIDQQIRKIEKTNIDVRLNTEVTPEYAKEIGAEVLIAALGAKPVKPAIPGIDGENVYFAEEVYTNPDLAGENVVIMGGGLVGMELAIYLKSLGKNVNVLEMAPRMNMGPNSIGVQSVEVALSDNGIVPNFSTKVTKVEAGGVWGETKDGEKFFPAETIVCALGQKSLTEEAMALYDCGGRFTAVGDCVIPGNISEANASAKTVALDIGRL